MRSTLSSALLLQLLLLVLSPLQEHQQQQELLFTVLAALGDDSIDSGTSAENEDSNSGSSSNGDAKDLSSGLVLGPSDLVEPVGFPRPSGDVWQTRNQYGSPSFVSPGQPADGADGHVASETPGGAGSDSAVSNSVATARGSGAVSPQEADYATPVALTERGEENQQSQETGDEQGLTLTEPEGGEDEPERDTARQLVSAIEEAAEVAAGAAADVEALLKSVNEYRDQCHTNAETLENKISSCSERAEALAANVAGLPQAMEAARNVELFKFMESLAEAKETHNWEALASRQRSIEAELENLRKEQEDTARDWQMLKSSYLSLEGTIQEQLKRVVSSAEEAAASSYRLLSDRFRELVDTKVSELQRQFNSHRLEELAADRTTSDMIAQLKKKGVAVVDASDLFPSADFEAARREFTVRLCKRIRAFFMPVFIVTQTQEEFSDWLYTHYHLVPSQRLMETVLDELSLVNNREAYAVLRIETVSTDVIIRAPLDTEADSESETDTAAAADAATRRAEQRQERQRQSLTEGRLLPVGTQPSQESLVMASSPFFGSEVVKRFSHLTKSYLRSAVSGHLSRRAIIIVYLGDRKGEVALPSRSSEDVLRKLDIAEKLCSSFSAPSQEVAALWRHMNAEVQFFSLFFRMDPLVFGSIPACISFEQAKLPPMPPSPLFRGEFGVVQLQALCAGGTWAIPSARVIQAAFAYISSHPERGGAQVVLTVTEEKLTTFWRSRRVHEVKVTVRTADTPRARLRIALSPEDPDAREGGKAVPEKTVVLLQGESAVKKYLHHALAKFILPAISARAPFRRVLMHVCIVGKTC